MGRSMSRLFPEVKTFRFWPEFTRARATNHLDSATSPGILPQVWASASHLWKVMLLLIIPNPRFEIRALSEGL